MQLYYITFRSATFAQRGEKLLDREGIRSTILRTPRWMENQGCGYALKLWTGDIARVIDFLRRSQILWRRVYVQMEDAHLEEMAL